MKDTSKNDYKDKKPTLTNTYPVPLNFEEIKENIIITTNNSSKATKEQLINQAFNLHSQGNISEAVKYYKYFIDQGFKDHRVFSNYGIILKDNRNLQKAEIYLTRAIEIKPDFPNAHFNLGLIFNDLGKPQKAVKCLGQAIKLEPNLAEAHYNLGSIFRDLGNLEKAKVSIKKSIELKPDYADAHLTLGLVFHDLNELKEAERYLSKAIIINPNLSEAYYNLGIIFNDLGEIKKSYDSYMKAIKIKPNFTQAHANLGLVLKDSGNLEEAEIYIRKAIRLNPNLSELYSNLGIILIGLGRLIEAELSQLKAIELNPDLANAHYNLGNILRETERLKEAELSLKKAIELNPALAQAHRDLSICLYLMGKKTSALKSIIKANSLNPKELTIRILLEFFKVEQNHINISPATDNKEISLKENKLDSNPLILNRPVESELIDSLYKIKARDQEKYQAPTYGNAKGSDYYLFERNEPIINIIKDELINIACKSVNSNVFISESFFTIFRSGGGLTSHDHINKLDQIKGLNLSERKFSLVYYLSVGDQNCEEPGILKLEDPSEDILPSNGLIIIFPATRKHSVFYKGQKDRIIIGVNFYML